MSRFLLGALAMGALLVLTSFAVKSVGNLEPPCVIGGPAWTVAGYQLDRAFRVPFPLGGPAVVCQVPPTGGFVITQLRSGTPVPNLTIDVNGQSEYFTFANTAAGPFVQDLNPPIIARPNDIVTITSNGGSTVIIGGYTTLPGET